MALSGGESPRPNPVDEARYRFRKVLYRGGADSVAIHEALEGVLKSMLVTRLNLSMSDEELKRVESSIWRDIEGLLAEAVLNGSQLGIDTESMRKLSEIRDKMRTDMKETLDLENEEPVLPPTVEMSKGKGPKDEPEQQSKV